MFLARFRRVGTVHSDAAFNKERDIQERLIHTPGSGLFGSIVLPFELHTSLLIYIKVFIRHAGVIRETRVPHNA